MTYIGASDGVDVAAEEEEEDDDVHNLVVKRGCASWWAQTRTGR